MLSYVIPVEERSPTTRNHLNLNLRNGNNGIINNNGNAPDITTVDRDDDELIIDENTKLLSENLSHSHSNGSVKSQNMIINEKVHNSINSNGKTNGDIQENENGKDDDDDDDHHQPMMPLSSKIKTTKTGQLKRVSFGSSKGSMVETLVFETPTPVSEYPERHIGALTTTHAPVYQNNGNFVPVSSQIISTNSAAGPLDDSGIELQEEVERSKVRVTFIEHSKPQQISTPELNILLQYGDKAFGDTFVEPGGDYTDTGDLIMLGGSDENSNNKMAANVTQTPPNYDRQQSTDSGWDNPFRPGGDLSREADEIVNLIKGGKPITPTTENHINGNALKESMVTENGTTVIDGVIKTEVTTLQSVQNGTKSPKKPAKNGDTQQVSKQVISGPQSATTVVIDEKKKKKSCCVIQ